MIRLLQSNSRELARLWRLPRAVLFLGAVFGPVLVAGCVGQGENKLRDELTRLREENRARNDQLVAQRATIDELNVQLRNARGINEEDLKKLYYPKELVIDRLTGGADYDGQPGDDGVTVYLRPIDQYGDVIKIPGDVTIQLYDLAAAPDRNFLGEYRISVDQLAPLWHGRLMTGHFTIKCPWAKGPPQHDEITVRATFVDYLTKRVVSAQTTCKVKLPPK